MNTVWTLPDAGAYDPYFAPYIALVTERDVLAAQESQIAEFRQVFGSAPPDELDRPHPPFAWTIQQVVAHVLDNERIFAYRALRFSVGDETDLPGYDQEIYTAERRNMPVAMPELVREFEATRASNLLLFRRIPAPSADRSGLADGRRLTVRAIAALQVGHLRHHLEIVKRRLAG